MKWEEIKGIYFTDWNETVKVMSQKSRPFEYWDKTTFDHNLHFTGQAMVKRPVQFKCQWYKEQDNHRRVEDFIDQHNRRQIN